MSTMTDTYTTPEGFELHKRLMMPDARSFADVLTYIRDWDFATMGHRNGVPGPEHIEDLEFDGNHIGAFCAGRRAGAPNMAVRPTQATLDALEGQMLPIGDHLGWELTYHKANDRVLVILDHNKIIGSRYVAYIDPATVPGFDRS